MADILVVCHDYKNHFNYDYKDDQNNDIDIRTLEFQPDENKKKGLTIYFDNTPDNQIPLYSPIPPSATPPPFNKEEQNKVQTRILQNISKLSNKRIKSISFIDTSDMTTRDEFQYTEWSQIPKSRQFDYIYPIYCPSFVNIHQMTKYLKPTGVIIHITKEPRISSTLLNPDDFETSHNYPMIVNWRNEFVEDESLYRRLYKIYGQGWVEKPTFHIYGKNGLMEDKPAALEALRTLDADIRSRVKRSKITVGKTLRSFVQRALRKTRRKRSSSGKK